MEKELTEKEAIYQLSQEMAQKECEITEKYKNIHCGRDGGETQELKKLHEEGGKRYCEIKNKYVAKHSE